MKEKPNVLIVGAGAIGLSIAGWIFPNNENLTLLGRGESIAALRRYGLRLYKIGQEATTAPMPIKVIESLDQIPPPDIIIITVKNYDLDGIAQTLRQQLGNFQPIVASLQNGLENQQILPSIFLGNIRCCLLQRMARRFRESHICKTRIPNYWNPKQ